MTGLTKKDRERRTIIIAQLSDMSRDGWRFAQPLDYQPLEAELRRLDEIEERARKRALGAAFMRAQRAKR